MSRRSNRYEKEFRGLLDKIRQAMKNYPDGKITDLIGANHLYDLMNRAVRAGRRAGYSDEDLERELIEARMPPEPAEASAQSIDLDPCAPGKDTTLRKGGKCHDIHLPA